MKKPAVSVPTLPGLPGLAKALADIRENLEVITGRRNNKIAKLNVRRHAAAGAAPTAAEFDALAADLQAAITALNNLLDRLDE